ncbi:MAG: transposase [Flavobacteriales bacterium Tduv]
MIHWEGMEKEIRKIYQKGQRIKVNLLTVEYPYLRIILLSHWYDLSDLGTEKLMKESLRCMCFCGFRLKD